MYYIETENLTFYCDDEPVLEDVSYYAGLGEFVILTGENGTAESTLTRNTLGLLRLTSGKITIAKKNSASEKISIDYIPRQVTSLNAGFPSTVIELACLGRFPRGRWFEPLAKKDHPHVEKALRSVDMWEMRHKRIGELSEGQR